MHVDVSEQWDHNGNVECDEDCGSDGCSCAMVMVYMMSISRTSRIIMMMVILNVTKMVVVMVVVVLR